jgi:hypothetical protein
MRCAISGPLQPYSQPTVMMSFVFAGMGYHLPKK